MTLWLTPFLFPGALQSFDGRRWYVPRPETDPEAYLTVRV